MDDHWTTKEVKNPYGVGLWRSIWNWWPKFIINSKIKVGNGGQISFCDDVCVSQHTMKRLFPDI